MLLCLATMKEREELIREIAQYGPEYEESKKAIQKYPWDCDEELYYLTRKDVSNIFERYLVGELESDDLVNWANFLEIRDDLGFESSAEKILDRIIFWLANPEINFDINTELVKNLKAEL